MSAQAANFEMSGLKAMHDDDANATPTADQDKLERSATSSASDDQDRTDMARLAGGHDAALNELMERHREKVFHYLIRLLQNEADAADAAEEAFVRVYQHREKYDSQQRFSTWLYTIATNLARDRLKWRARHPQKSIHERSPESDAEFGDSLPDVSATPDAELVLSERGQAVRDAIARLPREIREPLILATYNGLPQAEIAAILKCSVKAVETRIYRARQQLRQALEPLMSP